MKQNLKKVYMFFCVFIIGIFLVIPTVYAKNKQWPSISEDNISKIIADSPDYSLCVYNVGSALTFKSDYTSASKFYSNKYYAFAYNSKTDDLRFVDATTLNFMPIDSTYDWDRSGINQSITFGTKLKEDLVKNNQLSCNNLYFLDSDDNLRIYSDNSLTADFYFDPEDYRLSLIKSTGVTGTLKTGINDSQSLKCDDYLSKLKTIANKYYTEQETSFDELQKLKNGTFEPGTAVKAKEYSDKLVTLMDSTINGLDALNLTTDSTGTGFYIGNCTGSGSLSAEYTRLKNSLTSAQSLVNTWSKTLNGKLKAVDANGNNSVYDKDREAISSINNSLDVLEVKWHDYLTKIDTGKKVDDESCEGLLGQDLLDDISTVFTWIKITVPILLILLGSIDFGKAVLSDDQQELKKATSKFIKRCIIAVAIFFIPTIIMYLISFVDKIADVSCDVRIW